MAASTLAGAITFTGCAVMPSVTAFADTPVQTGHVSYDNEVMPIHTDVKTEAKPLMKGTSCTVSDGKNLYYAFEMMGVRMGIMKYNTKTGKKSEVYSYKIGKNKKGSNGFSQLSVDKKYIYATWDRYYGTDATKEYIYRIAKDGKSAKKLALGRDPQLVDGRIYYLALKSKSEDGMNYSEDTGTVMSMKTDGTDKKKVAQIVNSGDAYRYSLFQSEGKIYYTKENENKTFYDLEGNSYQREAFAVKDENYLSVSLEDVTNRLQMAGLERWVMRLKEANEKFISFFTNRNSQQATIVTGATKAARQETDAAYRAVVKRLNALAEVNGETDYLEIINNINRLIDRQKAILATRKTINAKRATQKPEGGGKPGEERPGEL